MHSKYEKSEALATGSDQWVANDSTVALYRLRGRICGALAGCLVLASIELSCRVVKNSVGCGVGGIPQGVGLLAVVGLFGAIFGGAVGEHIGGEHPNFRRLSLCFSIGFFLFQYAWFALLQWLPASWQGEFWNKDAGSWLTLPLAIFYFGGRWLIARNLKQKKPL